MREKLAFIAIGGNSLIKSKDLQTVEDQHQAIRETMCHVVDLINQGYQTIISHGNGPQVGYILTRVEQALGKAAIKNFMPIQPGDVPATWANVDDLSADVGFRPETPIEVGVQKFVDWYLEYYS